jgi:hypothetical protein
MLTILADIFLQNVFRLHGMPSIFNASVCWETCRNMGGGWGTPELRCIVFFILQMKHSNGMKTFGAENQPFWELWRISEILNYDQFGITLVRYHESCYLFSGSMYGFINICIMYSTSDCCTLMIVGHASNHYLNARFFVNEFDYTVVDIFWGKVYNTLEIILLWIWYTILSIVALFLQYIF